MKPSTRVFLTKNKLSLLLSLIVAICILFFPLPTIQTTNLYCSPCIENLGNKCPSCPQKGDIVWSRPIALQIIEKYFNMSSIQSTEVVTEEMPVITSPSIIPTSDMLVVVDENIKKCVTDQGAYIGGCTQGYTCFEQGNDQGCSRGKDCSNIKFNQIGDNKCHKSCRSNSDCPSGYTCLEKEVWHGDSRQTYKLCL